MCHFLHRIVPLLEVITAHLPPQHNLSNGKAEYGVVVSRRISLAALNFQETGEDVSVAAVLYNTNREIVTYTGTVLSGKQLREEKLKIVPGDQVQNVTDKNQQGRKSLRCSSVIPSGIVDLVQSMCEACHAMGNDSDVAMDDRSATSSKVIVILYEETNLFADNSLKSQDLKLASPVVGISVSRRDGITVPLTNLPQNVTINFSLVHVENVSEASM